MDGARFANALARLECSPAEMSWRAGVDILSFGATKNGGALCDAIVVFNPELADGLAVQLRRAGQVWSKMRFASAQLMAYIENGLWLRLAQASNAAAARIAAGIAALPGLRLLAPVLAASWALASPNDLTIVTRDESLQRAMQSAYVQPFTAVIEPARRPAASTASTAASHSGPGAIHAAGTRVFCAPSALIFGFGVAGCVAAADRNRVFAAAARSAKYR